MNMMDTDPQKGVTFGAMDTVVCLYQANRPSERAFRSHRRNVSFGDARCAGRVALVGAASADPAAREAMEHRPRQDEAEDDE